LEELQAHPLIGQFGLSASDLPSKADTLDFLMSHGVEPTLDPDALICIHDCPLIQAAQSSPHPEQPDLALRFEVFGKRMELANGYEELLDSGEYRNRFTQEQKSRKRLGKPIPSQDRHLLAALDNGLPRCSGVAVGWERLLMIQAGCQDIADISLFPPGKV
jgi:lysyl-tRNA synthetase class 2